MEIKRTKENQSVELDSRVEILGKNLHKEESKPIEQKWLSSEDVCQLLRISKRTLQSYRDQRTLPFAQIGRKIYYRASDIEAYLNAHYINIKVMKGLVA